MDVEKLKHPQNVIICSLAHYERFLNVQENLFIHSSVILLTHTHTHCLINSYSVLDIWRLIFTFSRVWLFRSQTARQICVCVMTHTLSSAVMWETHQRSWETHFFVRSHCRSDRKRNTEVLEDTGVGEPWNNHINFTPSCRRWKSSQACTNIFVGNFCPPTVRFSLCSNASWQTDNYPPFTFIRACAPIHLHGLPVDCRGESSPGWSKQSRLIVFVLHQSVD